MTIGQKLHEVTDKIFHKNADKTTGTSAGAHGTVEQAGTGAYAGNEYAATNTAHTSANPASAGVTAGGMGAGVTGANTHADGVVEMPGNQSAPVPTGEKHFKVMEDHVQEKERVERWTEHQPVEREYVTKVEATGNVKTHGAFAEGAVAGERIIGESTAFPTNTTTVHGVAGQTVSNNAAEANRY